VLALWPSHVLCAGLPEKELLVVALMPWIVDRAIAAYRGSLGAAVVAGVLTGLAVLVQPSLQLLPVAGALLALLLCRRDRLRVVVPVIAATLAMVAVVAPWTLRNAMTLGVPVFVSTNGGDVLYRANNELATGAYRPSGAVDLSHLDELSLDRESKRLAVEWITSNPAGFVQLGAAKALMFLGEDSYGAYAVFQRGQVEVGRTTYLVIKAATALPWLVLWYATLALALQRRTWERHVDADALAFVVLPVVYLLAIHSVFESGPKYHFPVLALAIAAFAIVSASTDDRVRQSRHAARRSEAGV
jgi:4-amino-4-deoxy-L-arabinose transferase-like glycosyltransferase